VMGMGYEIPFKLDIIITNGELIGDKEIWLKNYLNCVEE
jgi:hypothetical protein